MIHLFRAYVKFFATSATTLSRYCLRAVRWSGGRREQVRFGELHLMANPGKTFLTRIEQLIDEVCFDADGLEPVRTA